MPWEPTSPVEDHGHASVHVMCVLSDKDMGDLGRDRLMTRLDFDQYVIDPIVEDAIGIAG